MKREGLKFKGKGVRVRITKISVKGLFGMFDHEIPLNQESRITIVHGPNGVGKTVLMRMVHGLFNFEYEYIGRIPFEQLSMDFEDGTGITVEKGKISEGEDKAKTLHINCVTDNGEKRSPFDLVVSEKSFLFASVKTTLPELTAVYMTNGRLFWAENMDQQKIDEEIAKEKTRWGSKSKHTDSFVEAIAKSIVLSKHRPAILATEDLLERNPEIHNEVYGELPEWFKTIQINANTNFISTSRLLAEIAERDETKLNLDNRTMSYADGDAIDMIKHNYKSRENDPSFVYFPGALPAASEVELIFEPPEEIHEIDSINTKIAELQEFLADNLSYPSQRFGSLAQEAIEDLESEKLDYMPYTFYEAEKLAEMLNNRFLFKSFDVSTDNYTIDLLSESDGARIPFAALSSGEQQLLILYYQLVVKSSPDTLVMIDEPELSMNVVWQRNFLKDLQRIIELRKFDVLIATHSPQIIHDKWDWMVPLGEKLDSEDAD